MFRVEGGRDARSGFLHDTAIREGDVGLHPIQDPPEDSAITADGVADSRIEARPCSTARRRVHIDADEDDVFALDDPEDMRGASFSARRVGPVRRQEVISRQGQGPEHSPIQHDGLFSAANLDRCLFEELGEDNRTVIFDRGSARHERASTPDGSDPHQQQ
ncbi:hypothetical protein [Corallococcus exercitus]|uniref:Uncharacterized protein n=1 Tax=Corallococcus exercitus TaxID=2316736 RepID=A0A7Y4JZ57_9BACT|nr:hypothetical protein [Corallococcus exercitus]NOK13876.1 hypothetical protein [Corallococcus exercitus]